MMRSKKHYIGVLALLCVAIFGSIIPTVSGSSPREVNEALYFDPLVIDDAYYCDLDDDGLPDDCITVFTLYSPTGIEAYMKVDLKLSILLPSGQLFYFTYRIIEIFDELELVIEWYNVAVEEGWYIFTVSANIHGTDVEGTRFNGIVAESLEFDPHSYKDGAVPFAIVRF